MANGEALPPQGNRVTQPNPRQFTEQRLHYRKIVFTKGVVGDPSTYEVYVMNADGTGQTNLTQNGVPDFEAVWSPDGRKIAFSSDRFGDRQVFVMGADGADQTQLTYVGINGTPSWAPSQGTTPVPVHHDVQIDIKPGSAASPLNLASKGVIPITLFGSTAFDVTTVEMSSVMFAGASVAKFSSRDVNRDGYLDLVLEFRTQDTHLRDLYAELLGDADTTANDKLDPGVSNRQVAAVSLTGMTTSGAQFSGMDTLDLFLSGKELRDLLAEFAGRY